MKRQIYHPFSSDSFIIDKCYKGNIFRIFKVNGINKHPHCLFNRKRNENGSFQFDLFKS